MAERCYGCMQMKEKHPICEHCGFDENQNNMEHQLPLGTVLGEQYILGKVLGQGGFGITYLAWDQILNQPVAVKEYFPKGYASRTGDSPQVKSLGGQNSSDFARNKQRFLREAESLAALWSIPQIVRILRYFEENGTAYIAMEYVEGRDLRSHLKALGRPMTAEEMLEVLGPVVEALIQVHKAKLVHRDISPDNIMILTDGSAKLLDFGAARYVENADAEKVRESSTQAILKHGFAPPEQYSSHGSLGPWTDVYALCATMYYCLTGKIPPEAMDRSYQGAVLQWDRIPDLTRKQRTALEKGMALHPKERFASVEELWKQLKPKAAKPPRAVEEKKTPEQVKTAEGENGEEEKGSVEEKRALQTSGSGSAQAQLRKPTGKKKLMTGIALAVAVAICAAALYDGGSGEKPDSPAQTSAATIPETTTEPNLPPLEISAQLTMEGVDLGYTQAISVLSGHDASMLQWTSSDPQTAAVSEQGIVMAVGCGSAEITAQYQDQRAVCTVTVGLNPNVSCTFAENTSGWTIRGYVGLKTDLPAHIIFPDTYEGSQVTGIGFKAFEYCRGITRVTIPEGVVFIDFNAFAGCTGLTGISLPDSVLFIGEYAFRGCTSLENIRIPEGITSIPLSAFSNCTSLTGVTIPASVTAIEDLAFSNCTALTGITIPDGVTSIGRRAFSGCTGLTSFIIPDSVTSIHEYAFDGCTNLESVTVSANCRIAPGAFPESCQVHRR